MTLNVGFGMHIAEKVSLYVNIIMVLQPTQRDFLQVTFEELADFPWW